MASPLRFFVYEDEVNAEASTAAADAGGRRAAAATAAPGPRKREVWNAEEKRRFEAGLRELGRGKWSRIAREFVETRTVKQVTSYAQKYFIRLEKEEEKRKKKAMEGRCNTSGNVCGNVPSRPLLQIDLNCEPSSDENANDFNDVC